MKIHTVYSEILEQPQLQPQVAAKREHVNSAQHDRYVPSWSSVRPGADQALDIPSRINSHLHYRDGRVEAMT